ncbi:MAG TPA: FAD-dependent oxidoreductase [Gemmatimonadaceae bacterium]|nr:FAD-dependent oxidoreductase [Gemmatimonadaceae bacterium]
MSEPTIVEREVQVIGDRWSPEVHEMKDFLARSRVPYRWLDVEGGEEGTELAEAIAPGEARFPILLLPDGSRLVQPSVREVAERLGLDTEPGTRFCDLVIVGGGPAGLSASVYGASEGLRTIIVEHEVPGGQAGQSSRIENYPGFPEGLSGSDLASRTVAQAKRFGVEILVTREARALRCAGSYRAVVLDDGSELLGHVVLIATGVSFRWLDAPGCSSLVGAGIYYGAAIAEASAFEGQEVYILGGGNSAGQAAMLLAGYARRVVIVALEDALEQTMSRYLIDRIRRAPNIRVLTSHTIVGAEGEARLEHLVVEDVRTGAQVRVDADGLFVFIGAKPETEWLGEGIQRDEQGFILSGPYLRRDGDRPRGWPLPRQPYLLETSTPGVFVAGDVRHGSVKRVASAVGEGAMAVQFIHQYLADR